MNHQSELSPPAAAAAATTRNPSEQGSTVDLPHHGAAGRSRSSSRAEQRCPPPTPSGRPPRHRSTEALVRNLAVAAAAAKRRRQRDELRKSFCGPINNVFCGCVTAKHVNDDDQMVYGRYTAVKDKPQGQGSALSSVAATAATSSQPPPLAPQRRSTGSPSDGSSSSSSINSTVRSRSVLSRSMSSDIYRTAAAPPQSSSVDSCQNSVDRLDGSREPLLSSSLSSSACGSRRRTGSNVSVDGCHATKSIVIGGSRRRHVSYSAKADVDREAVARDSYRNNRSRTRPSSCERSTTSDEKLNGTSVDVQPLPAHSLPAVDRLDARRAEGDGELVTARNELMSSTRRNCVSGEQRDVDGGRRRTVSESTSEQSRLRATAAGELLDGASLQRRRKVVDDGLVQVERQNDVQRIQGQQQQKQQRNKKKLERSVEGQTLDADPSGQQQQQSQQQQLGCRVRQHSSSSRPPQSSPYRSQHQTFQAKPQCASEDVRNNNNNNNNNSFSSPASPSSSTAAAATDCSRTPVAAPVTQRRYRRNCSVEASDRKPPASPAPKPLSSTNTASDSTTTKSSSRSRSRSKPPVLEGLRTGSTDAKSSRSSDGAASGDRDSSLSSLHDDDVFPVVSSPAALPPGVCNNVYVRFLRRESCYGILPKNSKLVFLDSRLTIRKALFSVLHCRIADVMVWDSEKLEILGMLTIHDFIGALLQLYTDAPELTLKETDATLLDLAPRQRSATISDENEERSDSACPTSPSSSVSSSSSNSSTSAAALNSPSATGSGPPAATGSSRWSVNVAVESSLFDAVGEMLRRDVARLVLSDRRNVVGVSSIEVVLKHTLNNCATGNAQPTFMQTSIASHRQDFGCSEAHSVTSVSSMHQVLEYFEVNDLTTLPVVNDANQLVNVCHIYDVINLVVDGLPAQLNMTVENTLCLRKYDMNTEEYVCKESGNVRTVLDKLVASDIKNVIITDDDRHPVYNVRTRDVLRLLLNCSFMQPTVERF